jgi:hypothetical protein
MADEHLLPPQAPATPQGPPITPDGPDNQPNTSHPTVDDRPPVSPPAEPGPVTPPPRS